MNYPFGEEVKKVEQKDRSPKDYFVLGVYASAVHAKWIDENGKIKVKALAVASEPEIFWKGNNDQAEKIISRMRIPSEIGKLEVVDSNFNGPSGIELDKSYLTPLGLKRDKVWLCDLLPYSRLNAGQEKAIRREYEPLEEEYNLPKVTIEKVPSKFCNTERLKEIVQELIESKAKKNHPTWRYSDKGIYMEIQYELPKAIRLQRIWRMARNPNRKRNLSNPPISSSETSRKIRKVKS